MLRMTMRDSSMHTAHISYSNVIIILLLTLMVTQMLTIAGALRFGEHNFGTAPPKSYVPSCSWDARLANYFESFVGIES